MKSIARISEFPEDVGWEKDLRLIGFDSLAIIRLIVEIEEKYEFEFADEYMHPDNIFNYCRLCEAVSKYGKQ